MERFAPPATSSLQDLPSAQLHPLTLVFPEPAMERAYWQHYTSTTRRGLQVALGLLLLTAPLGTFTDRILAPEIYRELLFLRWAVASPILAAALALTWWRLVAHRLHDLAAATFILITLGFVAPVYWLLPASRFQDYLGGWIFAVISVHLLLPVGVLRATLVGTVSVEAALVIAWLKGISGAQLFADAGILHVIHLTCIVGSYLAERRDRRIFLREAQLAEEMRRTDELLLNILPRPIAERLKAGDTSIADAIPEAAVLFADLVGFTRLAERRSAAEVVRLLDTLITAFDELALRHGVEKIKTIGDAYMVAAGLPGSESDPLGRMAEMALAMRQVVAEHGARTGESLDIRVGLHAGPVVAGVIGRQKFSYDLWGDTVNTASRMESHGIPGSIQVSAAVQTRLRERYHFEPRGTLDIKGKGLMETFLLVGRR